MTISLVVALAAVGAQPSAAERRFIRALCVIESSNNPKAVGDNGLAVGILQIQPIMVKDVNRIVGRERFTLADRWDVAKSGEMCLIYTRHYGKGLSWRDRARIWNGGPKGHKKRATIDYARKFDKAWRAVK